MSRKKKLPKAKGLTRIDDPGGHGVGWYARVKFRGKTHSKYFADRLHKGTDAAFAKGVTWRNMKERELGKPRTERIVPAGRSRRAHSIGVYRSKASYVVASSPSPGTVRREFVSISKYGEQKAFERAVALRKRREREVYGGVVSATKVRRR